MKAKLLLLPALMLLAGCGASVKTVMRGEFDPSGRVAVLPFSGKEEDTGLSLAESFTTYLMDAGFDVMERAQLEKVLSEQKVSLSGAVSDSDMAQVGKLAGVKAVVTGSYRVRREHSRTVTRAARPMVPRTRRPGLRPAPGARPGPESVREETNTVYSGLTVKFVDVETGRVLLSTSYGKDCDADSVDKALSRMAGSIKKELNK